MKALASWRNNPPKVPKGPQKKTKHSRPQGPFGTFGPFFLGILVSMLFCFFVLFASFLLFSSLIIPKERKEKEVQGFRAGTFLWTFSKNAPQTAQKVQP
jgi:hypothetical protein